MKYLDLTLPTPEANLACDEALLDACEAGALGDLLRVWESPIPFVALGYSNRVDREVYRGACQTLRIPILRRCSGGGTVLQGPGCLNFSLIFQIQSSKPLGNLKELTCSILQKHCQALEPLAGAPIEIQGQSDLALGELKFSGSAQRWKQRAMLFHGTFLLSLDMALVEALLPLPSIEPSYRRGRSHRDFLTNLPLNAHQIKGALRSVWGAAETLTDIPHERMAELVRLRYATQGWNFRF